jgi:hypothetical protein
MHYQYKYKRPPRERLIHTCKYNKTQAAILRQAAAVSLLLNNQADIYGQRPSHRLYFTAVRLSVGGLCIDFALGQILIAVSSGAQAAVVLRSGLSLAGTVQRHSGVLVTDGVATLKGSMVLRALACEGSDDGGLLGLAVGALVTQAVGNSVLHTDPVSRAREQRAGGGPKEAKGCK